MSMTPIKSLRSLFVGAAKLDPYWVGQFDRWVATHIKTVNCTYTVFDELGPDQRFIEDKLKSQIAEGAFKEVKKETVRCWGQPPHIETTMTIEIIA